MNNAFFDILIAPVGKQPMPLLLPILEYAPIATYLLPTHEVRDEAEAVRKVAKQARCRVIIIDDLVDPYRADETLARCREICTRPEVVRQRVAINLSGGTAVMALGAQQAARELGLSMVYTNTDHGEIISLAPDGTETGRAKLAVQVSLEQYSAVHGAHMKAADIWGTIWTAPAASWGSRRGRESRFVEAARLLGAAGTVSEEILRPIRSALQQKDAQCGLFSLPPSRSSAAQHLLSSLVEQGCIKTEMQHYRVEPDDKLLMKFFEGVWLELYVADACANSGWFDDVRSAVEISRNENKRPVSNELDVMVSSRGRVAAISCKTGGEVASNRDDGKVAVYELDALLQADLMGLYARKVLATQQKTINTTLSNRAFYSQTCCITGGRLLEVAEIVRKHLDKPELGLT